jgi:hypothetical protein
MARTPPVYDNPASGQIIDAKSFPYAPTISVLAKLSSVTSGKATATPAENPAARLFEKRLASDADSPE